MSKFKTTVKKLMGPKLAQRLNIGAKGLRDGVFFGMLRRPRIKVNGDACQSTTMIFEQGKNIFFGYYDLPQMDKSGRYLLLHRAAKDASPARNSADIGIYDLKTRKTSYFARTNAWCWQQGARLRWHPSEEGCVLFNDVRDGHYICRLFDLNSTTDRKVYPEAFYDIDFAHGLGYSLNFSRLQRLRPGYGYSTLQDPSTDDPAPSDDGLLQVNLESGDKRLVVSLSDLAATCPDEVPKDHYINHVKVSPDGGKVQFFHIAQPRSGGNWRANLYVWDRERGSLTLLEGGDKVSHYCWKDGRELLETCWTDDGACYYASYDVETGEKRVLSNPALHVDGHPTWLSDGERFVTDTYPGSDSFQRVFIADGEGLNLELARLYHSPWVAGEFRCDLHPRVDEAHHMIMVDTICEQNLRSVLVLRLKESDGPLSRTREKPLVSCIVLAYRNFDYIYKTLDSIICQTYPRIELIVADDGSANFPKEEIERYIDGRKQGNIARVEVYSNVQNLGTVRNYNGAIRRSSGEYVFGIAGDDLFYDEHSFSQIVSRFLADGADIVTGKRLFIDASTEKPLFTSPRPNEVRFLESASPARLFEALADSNVAPGAGTYYSRRILERYGLFDEAYRLYEDWPFISRLVRGGERVRVLDSRIIRYRVGSGVSTTASGRPLIDPEKKLMYEREFFPYLDRMRWIHRRIAVMRHQEVSALCLSPKADTARVRRRYPDVQAYLFLKKLGVFLYNRIGGLFR